MNHKLIIKMLMIMSILITAVPVLFAQFAGGSGTHIDPYLIQSVEQLNLVRQYRFNHFRLNSNLDLGVAPWNENEGWEPIGSVDAPFQGSFDGIGFHISSLTINREMYSRVGLFGQIEMAQISNVVLDSVFVVGSAMVGALAGYATESVINNCTMSGDVQGTAYYIGGLVGLASLSSISNCSSSGSVDGYSDVGGLVGVNNDGMLSTSHSSSRVSGLYTAGGLVGSNFSGYCCIQSQTGGLVGFREDTIIIMSYATGNVTGVNSVGGLAGINKKGYIYDSYATGTIDGDDQVGGLVGTNLNAEISNSYSSGNVSGNFMVGGLLGFNTTEAEDRERSTRQSDKKNSLYRNDSIVVNSYAKGNVEGTQDVGGLIGNSNLSFIVNSYSIGRVSGEQHIGGLIGRFLPGLVINSYWDIETSQTEVSADGIGKTTAEMTVPYGGNVYVEWDFEEVWNDDLYYMLNDGYPLFKWQGRVFNPNPDIAVNPDPVNGTPDLSIIADTLSWSYLRDEEFSDPVGFRVYLNTTGEFTPEEDFQWLQYNLTQSRYSTLISNFLELDYETTYYWMVVPTTVNPDDNRFNNLHNRYDILIRGRRGDALEPEIWSFTTEEVETNAEIPLNPYVTALHNNYPNPFNPNTTIHFSLAEEGFVTLDIFNNRGQLVSSPVKGYLAAGEHRIGWAGTDEQGKPVSSGIYYYRMKNGSFISTGKMILMK